MAPDLELRPARFSDRFLAYLFDTVPFAVGAIVSIWVWGGPLGRPFEDRALAGIGAAWAGLAVLWQFVWNLSGGTPGKKLFGLLIVTEKGNTPGVFSSMLRAVGWLLSTPLANFGFLIALAHPRTRTLHDLIAGTFVVEASARSNSGTAAFLVAALAALGLGALNYGTAYLRPTPKDMAAIARAEEGIDVIARIQEAYRERHGTYADSIEGLAQASGDAEVFRTAMLEVFSPTPFIMEAGNRGWRVTAAAKDRRRTRVRRSGP